MALLVVLIIILAWLIRFEIKFARIITGKGSVNIEDSLVHIQKQIDTLELFKKETLDYMTGAETRLRRSIQAIETVRFNPFKGTGAGGNQSFATAIINQNGDGIVLSSLYSRDRVSIFAKSIVDFTSDFELSEEEKKVLKKATLKIR
jgi:hypothetical protein